MKILHILQSTRFSGAENVVCQIISLMNANTNYESLYCSRDGQIREALQERHIGFIPIKDLTISEVKRVISEQCPDCIHAHDMRASFVAALATNRIPIISHIHNNSFDSRGITIKSIAYLYAACRARHIFWVSDSAFNGYAFHSLLKKKSEVLFNIIDIDSLYRKMKLDENSYSYDIIFLGRLTKPKDPMRLMQVFRGIIDKRPDVKIAVVGTGELESETLKKAAQLQLSQNVDFHGFKNNPYKILYDSKLMILTSLWEGTPMCVLEAMSLGVPVISTPTDGVRAVVDDGKTGLLSDTNEGIIRSCIKIIENEGLRNYMSGESIKRARALMDINRYLERIKHAYDLEKNS